MTLVVQNPENPVSNANSYQSLADARTLASMYAVTLPVDDTEAETALIQGFAYLESNYSYNGSRATEIQNTEFPRKDLYIRNIEFPNNALPVELLLSHIIAAEAFGNGSNLWGGVDNGRVVIKEKLDVLETEYADNGTTGASLTLPRLESTIKPLLSGDNSIAQFRVGRA